jgi:PiT family inorganic phosphate transporter
LYKVIIPMFSSPTLGFIAGFLLMALLYLLVRPLKPGTVNNVFGKLQLLSASYMGFSHGSNDAQKTMGIIALALFTATRAGELKNVPEWLSFLHTPKFEIAVWIKIVCALTMAAGTAAGGWRIIKTLGHKMVRLHPVHGFAAETTAATVLMVAAKLGMPVSTTHAISTSIMGVGAAKNLKALRWELVERIIWTWFLTLPATGGIAYLFVKLGQALKLS